MKATTLTKAALFAGSLSFLAGSAFSQTAVSGAGGYETITINGNGAFTVFGQRLHQPILVSGTFDSQTAGSLTDADVDFDAVLTAGTTYLVELTGTTASEGTVIEVTSWSGNDITGLAGIVAADATDYAIRAAATINDVFGATNSAGFTPDTTGGGGSVGTLYVPDGAGFKTYSYIDLGAGVFQGWADSLLNPAGDVALNYIDGLVATEPGVDDLSLVVTGMVKTSPTVLPVTQLFTYLGTAYPVGSTLGNSGLSASVTADTTGGGGGDVVYIPKPDASGFDRYSYIDLGAGVFQGWADALLNPADDVALTSGLVIDQTGTGAAYNAKSSPPAFYANL